MAIPPLAWQMPKNLESDALKRKAHTESALQMLAAAMAGILTTLVVNPIWVINTRIKLAAQKRRDIASADTHAVPPLPRSHLAFDRDESFLL